MESGRFKRMQREEMGLVDPPLCTEQTGMKLLYREGNSMWQIFTIKSTQTNRTVLNSTEGITRSGRAEVQICRERQELDFYFVRMCTDTNRIRLVSDTHNK